MSEHLTTNRDLVNVNSHFEVGFGVKYFWQASSFSTMVLLVCVTIHRNKIVKKHHISTFDLNNIYKYVNKVNIK